MPHVFRRVILKPTGLTTEDSARLREALTGAVELQSQLAASPHVLQLTGGLQESQAAFFVEHEPGEPLAIADLFDPDAGLADEQLLLRLAIAVADALRAAHQRSGPRRAVHGGFCAGTMIQTPDGIHKVADFGIAPAICSVLGAPSYTELAVGPVTEGSEEHRGTGVWEVLPPDEETRDDRLCGFIAPEKYATQAFESFEPGSDVIAAGILLHLVAEHQHPLIGGVGEHRTVDMAAQMGFWLYNGARRKELRESENPAMKVWCDLVARMLANAPQQRPTAPQIVSAFAAVDIKPVDAAEMLNRAVESAAVAAKEGRWDEVRDGLAGIADGEGVPEGVAARAQALLREAECHALLEAAEGQLLRDDWQGVGALLQELESSPASTNIADAVAAVSGRFRGSTEAFQTLSAMESSLAQATESDPESTSAVIDRMLEQVEALPAGGDLVPSVQALHDALRERLLKKREGLATKLDALSADHETVRAWFKQATAAWKEERWDDLQTLLEDRPATAHWPKAVKLETQELETRFADVQATRAWLEKTADPLDAEDLDTLDRLLTERPDLSAWPERLRADVDEVERRIAAVKSKAAELARAQEWIESIDRAVGAQDWLEANRLFVGKPALENWPTDVLEREAPLRSQVEKHLKEVERERLAIKSWLSVAADAAAAADWSRALELLDAPPIEPNRLPKGTRKELAARKKDYEERLQHKRREELRERNDALHATAEALVGDVVRADLSGLLDPKTARTRIDPFEWDSDAAPTTGKGHLIVAVGVGDDVPADNGINREFKVRLEANAPRIIGEAEIKSALSEQLLDLIRKRQDADVAAPLRAGFFPDAKADMNPGEPAALLPVSIFLLGPDVKAAKVDVKLAWDPVGLTWTFRDREDFTRRAVDIAVRGVRSLIKPAILERSELLRRYESALELDDPAPAVPPGDRFPDSLTLNCRLTVHPRGKKESPPLQQVPVVLPQAGRIVIDADFSKAEAALRKILVDTQEAGRTGLLQSLTARVKQAATRIKLVSLTKQIKRPVDELRFELRVRRAEPLVVSAPWDAESFDFGVPEAAETAMQELIERQPDQTPPRFGRRAAALSGVAAMGAVVVVGAVYWPASDVAPTSGPNPGTLVVNTNTNSNSSGSNNSNGGGTTPNNDNTAKNGGGDTPGVPSDAPVRNELRAILARSNYLDDGQIARHRLIEINQVAATQTADVQIRIPGLRAVDLELTPPAASDDWQLTASDKRRVRGEVTALDNMLDEQFALPVADWVEAAQELTGYVNAQSVSVAPVQPTWTLTADGDAWAATGVTLDVSISVGGNSERIDSFTTELSADGGEVHLAPGQDETLRPRIVAALAAKVIDLQQASLQQHSSSLQADPNVNTDGRPLIDNSATTDWPTNSLQLRLTPADWMQPRDLTLDWDPETLAFQFDATSEARRERLALELTVLQTIRSEIARTGSGHWLGTVSNGDGEVKELVPPANGTWKLEVRALWNDAVQLPVEVAIDLSGDESQAIGSVYGAPGPWYEPLAEQFMPLKAGTARESLDVAETQSLKGVLGDAAPVELTGFLDAVLRDPDGALFTPQYEMQPNALPVLSTTQWDPKDANAEFLSVPASLLIATNRAAMNAGPGAGFDLDELDQTLADAAGGPVSMAVRLKLGQAARDVEWGSADEVSQALEAPAKLAAGLETFIRYRPAVESSLSAALDGAGDDYRKIDDLDAAYDLLKGIWRAKGFTGANPRPQYNPPAGDLLDFSIEIRQRWDSPVGGVIGLERNVQATVFVEYFSGIESVYALVWSVGLEEKDNIIEDGPFLVRVCARGVLTGDPGQPNQNLGALLLRPVLGLVPKALKPEDQFKGQLGIVVAVDDLLPEKDSLEALKVFDTQSSVLAHITRGVQPGSEEWTSLGDLNRSLVNRQCSWALRQRLLSRPNARELSPNRSKDQADRLRVFNAALAARVQEAP